MKKIAIVNKATLKIERFYDAEASLQAYTAGPWGNPETHLHIAVPDGLNAKFVIAQLGESGIEIIEDPEVTLSNKVNGAYNKMREDSLTEMKKVFGTDQTDSATAYHETWKIMMDDPSAFANLGLTSDRKILKADGTVLFEEGDPLDTQQKVYYYAERLLQMVVEYSAWRMQRIKAFRQERKNLLKK
jgi:hypothetical protein